MVISRVQEFEKLLALAVRLEGGNTGFLYEDGDFRSLHELGTQWHIGFVHRDMMDREGSIEGLMGAADPVMKYCTLYNCIRISGRNDELTAEAPEWTQKGLDALWSLIMDNPDKWKTVTLEDSIEGVIFEGSPKDLPKSIYEIGDGLFEIRPERKVAIKIVGDRIIVRAENQETLDAAWRVALDRIGELSSFSLLSSGKVIKGPIWEFPKRLAGQAK